MTDRTPIVNPKFLAKVHFGKTNCTSCKQDEMVFVGIMEAVDVMPGTKCEIYQCLHCDYNMIFALVEDGGNLQKGVIIDLDAEPEEYYCPNCNTWGLECADEDIPITEPCRQLVCRNCGQEYVAGIFDGDLYEDEDDD